jgi:two-component system CheB/CheR fusion protein
VRFEGPTPHKDLGGRDTEIFYAPDRDAAGAVRGFFVFVYDVTDRNRSQAALRDSETRLARAQRIAGLGDWEIDWATKKVEWSQEMYRLFGESPETFTPSPESFFARVPPDDHAPIRAAIDAAIEDRAPLDLDHRIVRPDGTIRFVREQAEVLRDAAGSPLRLAGTMHDITDRKAAEAALAASEREFRTIFELSSTGKGLADPYTGRLLRVNRRFCEIVGYSEPEMLAMSTLDFTHPDDRARDRERMDRLVAGDISEWQADKRYVRKDGQVVWVTVAGSLTRDAEGKPLRLIATIQDVTARRHAEEAVRAAKEQAEAAREQAEAANQAKDHFLAVLSHELRTPLTPVVMTLAGLEMDRSLSQGVRDDLAMIRRNVELETKLIDDLLDVTRIAHGKLRLHRQSVDSRPLIDGVIDLFHSELRVKRLDLRRAWEATDERLSGDPARLQQVFWNLVRNAIKFTPEGGHVTVRTHNPVPGTLAVEVSDDGVGIDPAALPRLFNAFEQAEQSVARQFGGLGLGLAISKALVELHGGSVRAESEGRGRGATFTVELPTIGAVEKMVEQIRPGAPHAAAGVGLASGTGATSQRPPPPHVRVLLVEDHPDTLRVLKRLLEKMGYAVVPAATAADALRALATHSVDVIVSDIGLPDGTGHDLMRKVRASEAHGGLPAIAISGFGMDADVRNSHAAGFHTHMTKPVDVRQLDAAIRTAVTQKGAAAPPRA